MLTPSKTALIKALQTTYLSILAPTNQYYRYSPTDIFSYELPLLQILYCIYLYKALPLPIQQSPPTNLATYFQKLLRITYHVHLLPYTTTRKECLF